MRVLRWRGGGCGSGGFEGGLEMWLLVVVGDFLFLLGGDFVRVTVMEVCGVDFAPPLSLFVSQPHLIRCLFIH